MQQRVIPYISTCLLPSTVTTFCTAFFKKSSYCSKHLSCSVFNMHACIYIYIYSYIYIYVCVCCMCVCICVCICMCSIWQFVKWYFDVLCYEYTFYLIYIFITLGDYDIHILSVIPHNGANCVTLFIRFGLVLLIYFKKKCYYYRLLYIMHSVFEKEIVSSFLFFLDHYRTMLSELPTPLYLSTASWSGWLMLLLNSLYQIVWILFSVINYSKEHM